MASRITRRQFLTASITSPFLFSFTACGSSGSASDTQRFPAVLGTSLERSGPIVINADEDNVVISGKHFADLGSGEYAIDIRGDNTSRQRNIVIRDCLFSNVTWSIRVNDCSGVDIHSCRFDHVGQGARFENCSNVQFDYNECFNVAHREVGNGWWAVNAVQFVHCGGAGNSASYNLCEQQSGQTPYLEDVISWYNSGGTAQSPAQCSGNQIRGGDASQNGTGIMLGDMSDLGGYGPLGANIIARDNRVVNTQNVGIAIAGGQQMSLQHNQVVMETAHSATLGSANGVGIYIYDYSQSTVCSGHAISGNRVWALNGNGAENHFFDDGTCQYSERDNVFGDTALNSLILPENLFTSAGAEYFSQRVV